MTIRKLHKWLSIIIGLQIVIWVTSGTIISLLDQRIVSGGITKGGSPAKQIIGDISNLIPISKLKLPDNNQVQSATLSMFGNKLSYRVDSNSSTHFFNAYSGAPIEITQETATRNAQASYIGAGTIVTTELLANGSDEVTQKLSVWRVQFDDDVSTRVYVSASDGSVLAHRNRHWKVVDFLLMLHFMDYADEHNFNNVQIILVAFCALWLTLSGLLLVKINFTRKDFSWRGISR